ncbi:hypothetical protein [Acidiphilium sp. PM]|uniref:hypothetical protein n=1 Tax=Acidiphilium sp. PM TaxID=1043206 RepID=UPI00110F7208|nr:hypothetical protein [Acidiphilium sp. PM]
MKKTICWLVVICAMLPWRGWGQDANYTESGWFIVLTNDTCSDIPGAPGQNIPMDNYQFDKKRGLKDRLIALVAPNGVAVGVIVLTPASSDGPRTTAVYFKTQLWCEAYKNSQNQLNHVPLN